MNPKLNDLIRRKDVLAALEAAFNQYGVSWGEQYGGFASAVPNAIKSIPTAYDPDKVVEILNCWREEQRKSADELRAEYSNSDVKIIIVNELMKLVDDIINDTIEIVKKGGVE